MNLACIFWVLSEFTGSLGELPGGFTDDLWVWGLNSWDNGTNFRTRSTGRLINVGGENHMLHWSQVQF